MQQYNLGSSARWTASPSLSVAYAASKGTHLVLSQGYTGTGLNLDQLPDQYDSIGGNPTAEHRPVQARCPIRMPDCSSSGGQLDQPTVFEGYLLKPYPQYTGVSRACRATALRRTTRCRSAYKRTFSHGGWCRWPTPTRSCISNTDNTSSFEDGQGGQGVVQDNNNIHPEKSVSLQDLTHNLVINYGVDLPFGHGQKFLSGQQRRGERDCRRMAAERHHDVAQRPAGAVQLPTAPTT